MEVRKDWGDAISSYLRELFQSYISHAELVIKEHFSRIGESTGDEKKKIQKQLQATEIMERKLIQIEKNALHLTHQFLAAHESQNSNVDYQIL